MKVIVPALILCVFACPELNAAPFIIKGYDGKQISGFELGVELIDSSGEVVSALDISGDDLLAEIEKKADISKIEFVRIDIPASKNEHGGTSEGTVLTLSIKALGSKKVVLLKKLDEESHRAQSPQKPEDRTAEDAAKTEPVPEPEKKIEAQARVVKEKAKPVKKEKITRPKTKTVTTVIPEPEPEETGTGAPVILILLLVLILLGGSLYFYKYKRKSRSMVKEGIKQYTKKVKKPEYTSPKEIQQQLEALKVPPKKRE